MNEKYFHTSTLIQYQRMLWKIIFLLFTFNTLMLLVDTGLADIFIFWSLIGLFVATGGKLVILAVEFYRARLHRFSILCYLLLIILASTILIKYWLL